MPTRPTYKRGDVVLVLFPHSDLRMAKQRPALVVQADHLDTGLAQVIVSMITSKLFRAAHPSTDLAISRVIGQLPMVDIDRALQHTLGL